MTSVSVYFVTLLFPVFEAAAFHCDYSYIPSAGWFKLHSTPTYHHAAKRICYEEGANMVTPETNELETAALSLINNTAITEIHTDIIVYNRFNGKVYVLTKYRTYESRPAQTQFYFICHKLAQSADYSRQCRTTDNEYSFEIRTGNGYKSHRFRNTYWSHAKEICTHDGGKLTVINDETKTHDVHDWDWRTANNYSFDIRTRHCYKFHRFRNIWPRAQEICNNEGGDLAVINSETEAQVIRDLFQRIPTDSIPGDTWKDLAFVGINSVNGRDWKTVDRDRLSRSGYDKWGPGEPNNAHGDELCGTVLRNALLYDNPCNREVPFICEKFSERCDYGYELDIRSGYCYKFHCFGNTWSRAKEICTNDGANLTVIDNETEADVIRDLFKDNCYLIEGDYLRNFAFLGIKRDVHGWDWKTIHGDSLSISGYDKWAPGEPNNAKGDEYCVIVSRNGLLIDSPCDQEFTFICEKKNQDCDEYTFDIRTGSCYKFHRIRKTWFRALEVCNNEGGSLAVINNEAEAQVIRDLFKNVLDCIPDDYFCEFAIIGIRRDVDGWDWKTVNGDSLLIQDDKWAPGEPNNLRGNEYCLLVSGIDLSLRDYSCDVIFPFICEKKHEYC